MSVCTFVAADIPLKLVSPSQDYPLEINIDTGEIFDGGADDNFFLHPFEETDRYTEKKYGASLEWHYTPGRARRIAEYIAEALRYTDTVELWHVWLMDCWEFEDRPFIRRKAISIDELTVNHIKDIDSAEIWNTPDKMYPERPSFYCLVITR